MSQNVFKKAERSRVFPKLALTGPSGSGKTYSALQIAKGLGGKIAVIDTENGSASMYAGLPGMPEFDVIELRPPFLSSRYIELIKAAVAAKYDTLIVDSITHQWNGEGGIMDRKDKEQLAKPTLNGYTLWSKYTPEHETFKQAVLQSQIAIIATIRSKQEYVLEQNDKGKTAPRKVGLAPVQRDGIEYEFSVVFDLNTEHVATVSKDRTGLFDGRFFKPDHTTGEEIRTWLSSGAEMKPANVAADTGAFSEQTQTRISQQRNPGKLELDKLKDLALAKEWPFEKVVEFMTGKFGTPRLSMLTMEQFNLLMETVGNAKHESAIASLKVSSKDFVNTEKEEDDVP